MAIVSKDKVALYFSWPKRKQLLMKAGGGAVLVCVIGMGSPFLLVVGLAGLVMSIFLFYIWRPSGVTDQDIDDTFIAGARAYEQEATRALNVELSDLNRPIDVVWGPFPQNLSVEQVNFPYHVRKGDDGVWRGNTRMFLLLLYGANQVMTFRKAHNIEFGVSSHPETTEYFYRDVVSVDANHTSFTLTTSGGTTVVVPLSGKQGELGDLADATAKMNNVRAMLREKKAFA